MSRLRALASTCVLLASAMTAACVPAETRPPPGVLTVTVGGPTSADGGPFTATTVDGWTLSFDRVLVAIENAQLYGSECAVYDDTGYGRVFDAMRADRERLALLHARGTCSFAFQLGPPHAASIAMPGVTAADVTEMRTSGRDRYAHDAAAGVVVRGSARNGLVRKTFSFALRLQPIAVGACALGRAVNEHPVVLASDDAHTLALEVHPEALFRDDLAPSSDTLRFKPFADADELRGDHNGDVTLDELANISFGDVGLNPSLLALEESTADSWTSFADYVYLGLFPRIVRRADAVWCRVNLPR